jgi:hypothetical protein
VLIRKDVCERTGPFDTSLRSVEDRDMWLRVAARDPVWLLKEPLYWYRIHSGNMSSAARRMEDYEWLVLKRAFADHRQLTRRFGLKSRALSTTLYSAALAYRESGAYRMATLRCLQSFLRWPFSSAPDEPYYSFTRSKVFFLTLARMFAIARPASAPHFRNEQSGSESLREALAANTGS